MTKDATTLLTAAELAAEIKVGRRTIGAWTKSRRIPALKLGRRCVRYDLARVNAALAGVRVELVQSDILQSVDGEFDLIVANPPYMQDVAARTYRHGGGDYGEALSARIVREALPRLAPGGTLLLYTGSAIVNGFDTFLQSVQPTLAALAGSCEVVYAELDPDVFGEELETPAYASVERIAAVALTVRVSGA